MGALTQARRPIKEVTTTYDPRETSGYFKVTTTPDFQANSMFPLTYQTNIQSSLPVKRHKIAEDVGWTTTTITDRIKEFILLNRNKADFKKHIGNQHVLKFTVPSGVFTLYYNEFPEKVRQIEYNPCVDNNMNNLFSDVDLFCIKYSASISHYRREKGSLVNHLISNRGDNT